MNDIQMMQLSETETRRLLDAVAATEAEIEAYLAPIHLTDESQRKFFFIAMKTKAFAELTSGRTPNVIALFAYAAQCLSKLEPTETV